MVLIGQTGGSMKACVRLLAGVVATCAVIFAWSARVNHYAAAQQAGQTVPESSPARDALRGADRPAVPLPAGPEVFTDSAGIPFRVVPINGLSHPWSLAFLPHGDILVTELGGTLRIIRNGALDPQPLAGVPEANSQAWRAGLMDVAVHPRYADNKFVYLTYSKTLAEQPPEADRPEVRTAVTLARARFEGGAALTDVEDVFVSDIQCGGSCASRMAFARDGTIIMTIGMPRGEAPQDPATHAGKILRLNDDGSVPRDNPFVDRAGYRPEIYALGIRNAVGLFVHPETGEIWETEHGPMGGDEINIIEAGKNYGWPVISYGRDYSNRANRIGRPPAGGHGGAVSVLEPLAGSGRNHHLHGRQVSGLEGEHLRGRARRSVASGGAPVAPYRLEPAWASPNVGETGRCCTSSSGASATSSKGLTDCCMSRSTRLKAPYCGSNPSRRQRRVEPP